MTATVLAVADIDITAPVLLLGLFSGLTYGLLAVGLVLVYRSSRFINFAQGAIGLFAAALFAQAVNVYGLPYWVAFLPAIAAGAGISAWTEKTIVRRLEGAPRVLSMVATLGLGQALVFIALSISGDSLQGLTFPQPPGFPEGDIGSLFVNQADTATAILSPLVLIGLVLFLRRSRYGVAIRGAAANPDAAATAGLSPAAMSMLSWALAGGVAAFSAMLFVPTRGVIMPATLGPDLLLRGLAAATIARFENLGVAVAAAIGLGVTEQVLATSPETSGWFEVLVFIAIGTALFFQPQRNRATGDTAWGRITLTALVPVEFRNSPRLRWALRAFGAIAVIIAALVPLVATNQLSFTLITVIAFATIGLSVVLITGDGGQLSLGQFAIAGVGAAISIQVVEQTEVFALGLLAAAVGGALVSAVIGLPALRVQGLRLAVLTLAFAVATSSWLLKQDWMLGSSVSPPRPVFGSIEVDTSKGYYLVALAGFVLFAVIVANLRSGAFGRRLRAVRDNEDAARALGVSAARTKLIAYALAGSVAAVGGALFGHANTQLSAASFPVAASVDVVAATVIGGLGAVIGPLMGAAYLIGIPQYFDADTEALSGLSAAWLALIVIVPAGLAGLLAVPRARLLAALARWLDPDAGAEEMNTEDGSRLDSADGATPQPASPIAPRPTPPSSSDSLLQVNGLSKSFGDLMAVRDVTLSVTAGETLGLIGPNGAGKTTLFEMISGYVRPNHGQVLLDGVDITRKAPEKRAELGLVRSFQTATLFPTMSAREAVMVAAEADHPAPLWKSVLGVRSGEQRRGARADQLLASFGVAEHRNTLLSELSTGTRRIVELACTVARRPRLLLLDEPSAGVAQADTAEMVEILRTARDTYGITLVVIEHDMAMLMEFADRMIALEVGSVIAEGTPEEVRRAPRVVEAYLG
jgi:ABC-type branched-subunit amino acid transport system ATPase component/branched-subunit amino acid ABC-type transport system permease component